MLREVLDKLPLMPDACQVFAALRASQCRTALISSGLPTFLVEELRAKLHADYAIGFEAEIKDNVLTGEIRGEVIERQGKLLVLRKIVADEGVAFNDCVVVADDRNNSCIFLKKVRKIGYNPDFILRAKADAVISGGLSKILPLMNSQAPRKRKISVNELIRELIHASGFFVPILVVILGIDIVALFIGLTVFVYSVSEIMRLNGKNLPVISHITRLAASPSESYGFTLAPVYFALGILLTLILFPFPISSLAIAVFALGDSSASLIGGTISTKGLLFNRAKTLEGSLGGLYFAFLAGLFFASPWIALIGAVTAMIIEYLPLPVNDNLLIPVFTGLILTSLI